MNFSLRLFAVFVIGLAAPIAGAKEKEEIVALFQNRKVTVAVPEGLTFAGRQDAQGMITVLVADPKDTVRLQISFLPDLEDQYSSARGRRELMNEMFAQYVASSVEKAMEFVELEPKTGAGTYCVFKDASLVGKTTLPPGEYLHLTTGVKTWPGVAAVFTLFSNDTQSKEYQAALKMLRESVQEKTGPLL